MISNIKNNKSLTFYQPTNISQNIDLSLYNNCINTATVTITVYGTSNITTQFINKFNAHINSLHAERDRIAQKVADGLKSDPLYKGARGDGVNIAWAYEKADIELGGKGFTNWTKEQRQEILKTGRVRGAEGHHQKNVADHLEEQGNPDNIKFYKSKQEHLEQGHHGNWKNESDAPMTDKDKGLAKTTTKSVFKNELRGVGIAAALGVSIGFTIGFTVSLAQSGITPDSIKYAFAEGGKAGVSSGVQSVIGYGIGRTVGQLATNALEGVLSNVGLDITENISKMCNMASVGMLTIAIFSTYQFIKLKRAGMANKEALVQIGKQALFSLSLLAVLIVTQGIWGGSVGLIVSISIGIIFITYSVSNIVHQRKVSEEIRTYAINKYKPSFV